MQIENLGACPGFRWQQQQHMGNFHLHKTFPFLVFPFKGLDHFLMITFEMIRLNPSSLNPTQNGTSASSTAAGKTHTTKDQPPHKIITIESLRYQTRIWALQNQFQIHPSSQGYDNIFQCTGCNFKQFIISKENSILAKTIYCTAVCYPLSKSPPYL